jgi:hypothetical protein
LVRFLIDLQGLSVAGAQKVLAAIDAATVDEVGSISQGISALSPLGDPRPVPQDYVAHPLVAELGSRYGQADPNVYAVARALETASRMDIPLDPETLAAAHDLLGQLAAATLRNLPEDPADAVEQVVVGTAIQGQIISALWLLVRQAAAETTLSEQEVPGSL